MYDIVDHWAFGVDLGIPQTGEDVCEVVCVWADLDFEVVVTIPLINKEITMVDFVRDY